MSFKKKNNKGDSSHHLRIRLEVSEFSLIELNTRTLYLKPKNKSYYEHVVIENLDGNIELEKCLLECGYLHNEHGPAIKVYIENGDTIEEGYFLYNEEYEELEYLVKVSAFNNNLKNTY